MTFDIVIPTVGRPSLEVLLRSLDRCEGERPNRILVVDDKGCGIDLPGGRFAGRSQVLLGSGRGPAAARNAGWRAAESEWVVFLDDDVVVPPDWLDRLAADLDVEPQVGAVQGRIVVPRPPGRRPTDWERNTIGLESARYATADMAYRRRALEEAGGFDERFPRAYREDADLALRCMDAGYRIVTGSRKVVHPVRPASPWVSLKVQKGNADDALMNALHGGGWRDRAGAPKGSRNRHLAVTALGAGALLAAGTGAGRAAVSAAAGWAALTAGFAWKRIAPGPRTPGEVAAMVATSAAIPPLASYHWVAGLFRARRLTRLDRPAAVLVDRDGTLIKDVPYNGDPELVEPMPGALSALRRLREAEIPLAVISNQSGVARGLISLDQVAAVNQRVERELGPLGRWFVCPHGEADGCRCRKPAPGLLLEAVDALRVPASRCVFIGDIGSDVEAARAAGMRPILVPTRLTRPEEIERAEIVAPNLEAAVDLLLSPRRSRR